MSSENDRRDEAENGKETKNPRRYAQWDLGKEHSLVIVEDFLLRETDVCVFHQVALDPCHGPDLLHAIRRGQV